MDLVIHAAGPFQRTEGCPVLEAAIDTKTNYMDVCDDPDYALRCEELGSPKSLNVWWTLCRLFSWSKLP